VEIWPQAMPWDASDLLDLDDILGGNSVPLDHRSPSELQAVSDLGEHPAFLTNKSHAIGHADCLPEGSRQGKRNRLPQVGDRQGKRLLMEIGHRIKRARESANMSQTDLAIAAKVSRGLVGAWENHTKKPGRETLIRVADATSVTVSYLIGYEEFASMVLQTRTPEEAGLLRGFRRLAVRQQKNLLQLVGISADVREQIEKQRAPSE
jgi:transcriptional regulator with XRE-family HTH domain